MRLLVVSDLHGAHMRLVDFLQPDDVLISLGDHVNIIDYKDLSGLLAQFVPQETIETTLQLIKEKKLAEARAAMAMAAGSVPDLFVKIKRAVHEMYFEMCHAFPGTVHFIYGNVDYPDALRANLTENQFLHEADVVEVEGRRFGLISGHPPGPFSFGMPGEVDKKTYAQRLHEIGGVDVLCVHPPPAIDGMSYDVVAERDEEGSADVLYYANLVRPQLVMFGHIHQPKVAEHVDTKSSSLPVRFINVGCFRDTGRLLQIDPKTLETTWVKVN